MVGGGDGWLGKKNENEELGKKIKKGKKKGGKLHEKGEKGLKNASFWVINFKNFRGGSSDPPCTTLPHTYSSEVT